MTVDELQAAGPVRAAALAAAASSLKMDLGVCGDRARIIAARAVDRALTAGAARSLELLTAAAAVAEHGHRQQPPRWSPHGHR